MNIKRIMKSGFSLMEMVIVVIIIGILLAAVTKMSSATKSAKVTTLMQGFQNLATAAAQYQNQNDGSYDGISVSNLVKLKILGHDWDNNGKKKNPFAGGFSIGPSKDKNAFYIVADGIPKEICTQFGDKNGKNKKYAVPGADKSYCQNNNKIVALYGSDSTDDFSIK